MEAETNTISTPAFTKANPSRKKRPNWFERTRLKLVGIGETIAILIEASHKVLFPTFIFSMFLSGIPFFSLVGNTIIFLYLLKWLLYILVMNWRTKIWTIFKLCVYGCFLYTLINWRELIEQYPEQWEQIKWFFGLPDGKNDLLHG